MWPLIMTFDKHRRHIWVQNWCGYQVSNLVVFGEKSSFLAKNRHFWKKSRFWSKIEIFQKIVIFQKSRFCQKSRFFPKTTATFDTSTATVDTLPPLLIPYRHLWVRKWRGGVSSIRSGGSAAPPNICDFVKKTIFFFQKIVKIISNRNGIFLRIFRCYSNV